MMLSIIGGTIKLKKRKVRGKQNEKRYEQEGG